MSKNTREPKDLPSDTATRTPVAFASVPQGTDAHAQGAHPDVTEADTTRSTVAQPCSVDSPAGDAPKPIIVDRGLSKVRSTKYLKDIIWLKALRTANRFRVIRTVDVALACFAERPYKAALTAAQRAMRGLVASDLLRRYRTNRFQTVYGLTQRGVDWLGEAGVDAASSVRRVSDMSNPEHRLWTQFLVLACEARGLTALTEQELLRELNQGAKLGDPLVQGLLRVTTERGKRAATITLRPDAIGREADGTTFFECDISKRGNDREASLEAEIMAIGRKLLDGSFLRRVVVMCKTERIRKRALAAVARLIALNNPKVLASGRRHLREVEAGVYEVWCAASEELRDGRVQLVDTLAGHVIIQLLPVWLPKVRIDSSNTHSLEGWLEENYLPYRRPASLAVWKPLKSPLL